MEILLRYRRTKKEWYLLLDSRVDLIISEVDVFDSSRKLEGRFFFC